MEDDLVEEDNSTHTPEKEEIIPKVETVLTTDHYHSQKSFTSWLKSNKKVETNEGTEQKEKENKNVKKDVKRNKEFEKEQKLKDYLNPGRIELSLNLDISNLQFNKLNNMIHLKITKDIFIKNRKLNVHVGNYKY